MVKFGKEGGMDKIDRLLLDLIQQDATMTTSELADKVGLSASPCARRIKRLEQEGVISGYRAMISRERAGIAMTVFVYGRGLVAVF